MQVFIAICRICSLPGLTILALVTYIFVEILVLPADDYCLLLKRRIHAFTTL